MDNAPVLGDQTTMTAADARFEAMVNAYSSDLYRYAYWLCRSRQLAEDLVQETFLRAWRFLDSLKDENKAKGWLITTLRREHARIYERIQPEFTEVDFEAMPADDSDAENDPQIHALRAAMSTLEPSYREPLVLQVIWGYSGEEIATLLEIPRATVNTRLFRARQQLRDIFEADGTLSAPGASQ
jgi:RNA polymerase sigma-70 factor (ECF subfamily)